MAPGCSRYLGGDLGEDSYTISFLACVFAIFSGPGVLSTPGPNASGRYQDAARNRGKDKRKSGRKRKAPLFHAKAMVARGMQDLRIVPR